MNTSAIALSRDKIRGFTRTTILGVAFLLSSRARRTESDKQLLLSPFGSFRGSDAV